MDLSPGSSSGPERAFAGWMVSVFIGGSILAWGHLECGPTGRPAFEVTALPQNDHFGSGLTRKSESFALALKRACTGGQFFRGTLEEFRVKDMEGRLRIIGRGRYAREIARRSHVTE